MELISSDSHNLLSYRFEHPIKQRYYHVLINQDLFGNWVLTLAWGGIHKATGRIINKPFPTYQDAKKASEKIFAIRKRRGYSLKQ